MKKWEVWRYPTGDDDRHPVVITSPQSMCDNPRVKLINAVVCTSLRPDMKVLPHHVFLNGADGMDNESVADCSLVVAIDKKKLIGTKEMGTVSQARRRQILSVVGKVLGAD